MVLKRLRTIAVDLYYITSAPWAETDWEGSSLLFYNHSIITRVRDVFLLFFFVKYKNRIFIRKIPWNGNIFIYLPIYSDGRTPWILIYVFKIY